MSDSKFHRELSIFVSLQTSLVEAFVNTFSQVTDFEFLIDAPRSGCVEVEGQPWLFERHGAGLAFKNWDDVFVDVHECFKSPELFDAWRLVPYFESIGKVDYEEDRIEFELSKLALSGEITRVNKSQFRLTG